MNAIYAIGEANDVLGESLSGFALSGNYLCSFGAHRVSFRCAAFAIFLGVIIRSVRHISFLFAGRFVAVSEAESPKRFASAAH